MKSSKLIEIFKDNPIVIPRYLLKNYKEFKLDLNEFLYLMYLYNKGDRCAFDPNCSAQDLSLELTDVMNLTSSLTDKGFMRVEVEKNEKGYMEEVVLLDGFYNKLKMFVIGDVTEQEDQEKDNSNIYNEIQMEFGRMLSEMEYEIIHAWFENHFSEDLIREALKEAVQNGVSNLKYMDKILYEWSKKGITTVQDVEANRRKRNASIEKKKASNGDLAIQSDVDVDLVMDWNWFDGDGGDDDE